MIKSRQNATGKEDKHMARYRRGRRKEHGIIRELLGWIIYILIIIGLTYLIITYVGQRTRVSGSSMETTLSDGDNLIVDKISYRFRDPKRYDIIVFPYKYEENTYYIKRIIGLPGETVQVTGGYVYINGELLESDIYYTVGPITLDYFKYTRYTGNDNNRLLYAGIGTSKITDIQYPDPGGYIYFKYE